MEEMKKKYVKICPKCKSLEVKNKFNPNIGLGAPTEYCCDSCGFCSVIFPEIEVEDKEEAKEKVEELKEEIKELKEEVKPEEKPKKRGRPKKIKEEIKHIEIKIPAPSVE